MVLVSLVDPRLLLDPPDSLFWGVKCRYNCDNIIVNTLLDLKVFFVIDPMVSVEISDRHFNTIHWINDEENFQI